MYVLDALTSFEDRILSLAFCLPLEGVPVGGGRTELCIFVFPQGRTLF
jgi:hypothetical protein